MYTRHYCVSANGRFRVLSDRKGELTAILTEFAEVCKTDGREVLTVSHKNGSRFFNTGPFCGFICLTDGTLIEFLPRTKEGTDAARRALCAEFCKRCGYTFRESDLRPDMNFLEYFISVFAGETMKIIKSGVLSTYTSREENLTSVQGNILFSENIRRNLAHRERVYVRHDVFTPDRAENRIIKAAAAMLIKLTTDPHSSHLLKEALSYLDEVAVPYDIAREFSKCINTRNTRKYGTILSICRMLFDRAEGSAVSGKHISCAQLYEISRSAVNKNNTTE